MPAHGRSGDVGAVLHAPAAGAADETARARTPLQVTVGTLAPAVVPRSGRITVSGQVTNRSKESWTDLRAYLFTSDVPLTSSEELDDAAATSQDAAVGSRLTADGQYDDAVGDLAPGETTTYRVSVPRRSLGVGERPGVYWIGVHVLGASERGERDSIADGRARTFIPQLPLRTTPTRLSLVVPVKQAVHRGAAGRLLGLERWQRSLSADGRLDRLLNLSGRATQPITWVVDPAVLDAAQSVSLDNPRLDEDPEQVGTDESGSPSASPSESGDAPRRSPTTEPPNPRPRRSPPEPGWTSSGGRRPRTRSPRCRTPTSTPPRS